MAPKDCRNNVSPSGLEVLGKTPRGETAGSDIASPTRAGPKVTTPAKNTVINVRRGWRWGFITRTHASLHEGDRGMRASTKTRRHDRTRSSTSEQSSQHRRMIRNLLWLCTRVR